jgi:hypothetical protein
MKKWLVFLLVVLPTAAFADDKIDPDEFICAELVAAPVFSEEPPLFELLQVDGYAGALLGKTEADPQRMLPLALQVYEGCQERLEEKVLTLWKSARLAYPDAPDSAWKADRTTCADYSANEENGSGFVIWLDGYNRQKNPDAASVLENDDVLKEYLEACARRPNDLMLDVMREKTKK